MRKLLIALAVFSLCIVLATCRKNTKTDTQIKIAVQTWSFSKFSFSEAVEKAAALGFKYIEMYPDQKISPDNDATTHFTASMRNRQEIKDILKLNSVQLVNYGVVEGYSKEEWIMLFDFAKEMGIETLVSEPEFRDYPLIDSLTKAYNIKLAVHNHAIGTRNWNPQTVIDNMKGLNQLVGVCPDNGHWMRSGIDPVVALKTYEGRILAMHIKDMNDFENLEAHTVPLGTGMLNASALIKELKKQEFSGVITIENEYNWEAPESDIQTSLIKLLELL
ncbi:MAG: sugar phosphate isomerase/epimerase [Bacteroidales bacterium]|nr:sugar phosphate isomerase/epimerase [Bacteroidales bacterium]MBN2821089.1 sugar phosphate isomerase/epimerase [Bacteroidales bacterium]